MHKEKTKIYIIGLNYSLKVYMQIHKKILNQILPSEEKPIDLIIPKFDRRSLINIISDLINIFRWLHFAKPLYIISVGPKIGFLFAIASFFFPFKLIHWFTGQQWALKKIKIFAPSYFADFIVNLMAYRTICDSKEQAFFMKKNFFIKKILFEKYGSINSVSEELHLIGKKRIEALNSSEFNYSYPIKVGFLGRICPEKGLEIIKELSQDKSLRNKFKFLVRGPSDSSISKSKNNLLIKNFKLKSSFNLDFEEGFIQNSEFFKTIDIFLFPSKREGFGSVALEAQACGLPVICSDIYGLHSSVIDGYGGIYCDNIKQYKNALLKLLDKTIYKRYCKNAFTFSLNYSEDIFSNKLLKLYQSIISID